MLTTNKANKKNSCKDKINCENCNIVIAYLMPVVYSVPYQKSKMKSFAKIVNSKKLLFLQNALSLMFDRVQMTLLNAVIVFFHLFRIPKLHTLVQKEVCHFFFFVKLEVV